jgi:uncharacterized protein (DUF3820 family)
MDNYLCLAIERGPVELSRAMLSLHGPYTQWFNVPHGQVGHLFQASRRLLATVDGLIETVRNF